jgi:two-component system phosphate regulon response regulator PhoB
MRKSILIVEDDWRLVNKLHQTLEENVGCLVKVALDLQAARKFLREEDFSLVILDKHLPDGEGLELLREEFYCEETKFLVLTTCSELVQRERAIMLGAVDYLEKPFSMTELVIKVRRLLKKQWWEGVEAIQVFGEKVVFFPNEKKMVVEGREKKLTTKETKILSLLLKRRNMLVSRQVMKEWVWESDEGGVLENTISAQIRRLRMKLGKFGKCLVTYNSLGYQLKMTV